MMIKVLETGKLNSNNEIIAEDAFMSCGKPIPLTMDFRPDTEWGQAKLHHIGNAVYAEIGNVPDKLKGLYLAPEYIRLAEPEIIDGVVMETNIEFTEISLTDKPTMGFMETL